MAQIVKKSFKYAVEGFKITEFERGSLAVKLPPDALSFAKQNDLLGEGKAIEEAEDKAVGGAPENKSSGGKKWR